MILKNPSNIGITLQQIAPQWTTELLSLINQSIPAFREAGWSMFTEIRFAPNDPDGDGPATATYGLLAFLYGTLVVSLVLAVWFLVRCALDRAPSRVDLLVNQQAVVNLTMTPSTVQETVTVPEGLRVEDVELRGVTVVMLFLSPRFNLGDSYRIAQDIVLVMDTSGSMRGPKMEQARKALLERAALLRVVAVDVVAEVHRAVGMHVRPRAYTVVGAERSGIERSVAYEVFASSAAAAPIVHYRRPVFEHPESAPVT